MISRVRERNKELVLERLASGCVRCGFEDTRALTFHHRDPQQKKSAISRMKASNYSVDQLKREMDKCDILCANCHMIEHSLVDVAQ